jgi:hypothetical protein
MRVGHLVAEHLELTAEIHAAESLGLTRRLEFRAERSMCRTHRRSERQTPLGPPNTVPGNPGFGTITPALDPRVFELALKLSF